MPIPTELMQMLSPASSIVGIGETLRTGGSMRGHQLTTADGSAIINWPRQNYRNGVEKNKLTGRQFKAVTRVLKSLRYELIDEGDKVAEKIPVVPHRVLGLERLQWGPRPRNSNGERFALLLFRSGVARKTTAVCAGWKEVNELKFLLGTSQPWTRDNVRTFLQEWLEPRWFQMNDQRYIKAIIFIAATVWAAVLYLNQQTIRPDFLKPISTVTTITVYVALAFERWWWKFPFLQGWLVKKPVIEGTWKVVIRSNWISPETREPLPSFVGYMVVRQTLNTLSMRLLTKESSSHLVGTEILCASDGLYCVSGVYRNEPLLEFRDRSDIHDGALLLNVLEDSDCLRLSGHYWTDRSPIKLRVRCFSAVG